MNVIAQEFGESWVAYNGDSCEVLKGIPSDSVDMSVYSPPFADLFTYSASDRDLGNSKTWNEFFAQYAFIVKEMLRITKSGRLSCVHSADIPALQMKDGYIGLRDFPGEVVRAHELAGWVFTGRISIDKNPQALKNGTPVLTPTGWQPIDSITIGDCVIGRNGLPIGVTGVYQYAQRQMYRISFSDKSTIECDGKHRWAVIPQSKRNTHTTEHETVVMTTDEIIASGTKTPAGKDRYAIPILSQPVQFDLESIHPIDPYLLGVIIGDGCIVTRSDISITTEHEIINKCTLPEKHTFVRRPNSDKGNGTVATYGISGNGRENLVLDGIRAIGINGMRAWEKTIPTAYLFSSIDARKELLQGLLDTDGTVENSGAVTFTTTSEKLASDVRFLVQSLGGIVTIHKTHNSHYVYKGETKLGRVQYECFIQINGDWCPFRLSRKSEKWAPRVRVPIRRIVSIEPTVLSDCTCITVDAPDGLFVTDECIVTHNSQALRTKSKGLLFAQMEKDSTESRPGLSDQILIFKKPGQNQVAVRPVENKEILRMDWILWARPVWYAADYEPGSFDKDSAEKTQKSGYASPDGIRETDTLQFTTARDESDEKHICPLQLGTIERCIKLYSNPGETVLSPFMGIGSEIYQAVRFKRKGIGVELKPSYYQVAVKNLKSVELVKEDLFSWAESSGK